MGAGVESPRHRALGDVCKCAESSTAHRCLTPPLPPLPPLSQLPRLPPTLLSPPPSPLPQ